MKIAIPDLISPSYFPAIAAARLGIFEKQGLDLTVELIAPVEKAYAALAAGEVEFVAGSAHSALSAFPEWRGVKLICAQSQGMYWFLVMRADIGARRGDLTCVTGRRIAAAPWVAMGLRRLLEVTDIDPQKDVEFVQVKGTAGRNVNIGVIAANALGSGEIDGFWANGMGAEIAIRKGFGTLVLDVRRGDGPAAAFNYTCPAIATTDAFLKSNPEMSEAVIRAIIETQDALKAEPGLAEKASQGLFPKLEASLITDLVKRDLEFYQPMLSESFVEGMNGFARDIGILTEPAPYERVVATQLQAPEKP